MQKYLKIYFVIAVFITFNSLLSQRLTDNWKLIKSDDISDIFIDPSKIVEYGNEISVWSLEMLREPRKLEKNEKILSIKTHYLFNKMKKRYAEIGIIYYDVKGAIVNRSSKSNFSSGPSAFMTPVSANENAKIVYKEIISYLITGDIAIVSADSEPQTKKVNTVDDSSISKNKESNKNIVDTEPVATGLLLTSDADIKKNPVVLEKETISNSSDIIDLSKESWNEIPQINKRLEIAEKPTVTSVSASKEFDKIKIDDSIKIDKPKQEYDTKNERALKNAIFTDGNLYCFQVSSWKTKAYADREVGKLISKGYKAYIVSVKPMHKRSIWHRVRVGYFNSLNEAKKIQREVSRN